MGNLCPKCSMTMAQVAHNRTLTSLEYKYQCLDCNLQFVIRVEKIEPEYYVEW